MKRKNKADAACADGDYLTAESQKELTDLLSRIEGHVGSIRTMVAGRRPADEILLQVAAVKAAINRVSARLLSHELVACMTRCMPGNRKDRLEKTTKVLATLLKQT